MDWVNGDPCCTDVNQPVDAHTRTLTDWLTVFWMTDSLTEPKHWPACCLQQKMLCMRVETQQYCCFVSIIKFLFSMKRLHWYCFYRLFYLSAWAHLGSVEFGKSRFDIGLQVVHLVRSPVNHRVKTIHTHVHTYWQFRAAQLKKEYSIFGTPIWPFPTSKSRIWRSAVVLQRLRGLQILSSRCEKTFVCNKPNTCHIIMILIVLKWKLKFWYKNDRSQTWQIKAQLNICKYNCNVSFFFLFTLMHSTNGGRPWLRW